MAPHVWTNNPPYHVDLIIINKPRWRISWWSYHHR